MLILRISWDFLHLERCFLVCVSVFAMRVRTIQSRASAIEAYISRLQQTDDRKKKNKKKQKNK